ncbi:MULTISPECIES: enoyl-CoA hydratase-related protein [unclassified Iodidimonas]|jgi:methylglutaconyl-CoA hydratase|uniref:enoyl-CoA hydratase-related protein n=1 Tax=unclassified Iodidimonas TaxID=2626145 RepID=UPI0024823059|nr:MULTISPECIES: enoyl-CoA hydratase-related protein [unclassified Iodidimonas]
MNDNLEITRDEAGIARISLSRPAVHNAFNDALIDDLHKAFSALSADESVRVIVLAAKGKSFCAGADLEWMKKAAGYSEQENHRDAQKLSQMLHIINSAPKPVIALVQGAALGGGVGLVACCDIVIAVRDALFGLSEVRLGLTPATISPYVIAKIGETSARRYFLSGERFDAETASKIGLVHETVGSAGDLITAETLITQKLLAGAPQAQAEAKALISAVKNRPIDAALRDETAARIAARRISPEAREGFAAFFEKRPPYWAPQK